jgi:hypothetical protein
MKMHILAAAVAMLFVCASAQADVTSGSEANSGSNSTSTGVGIGLGGQGGQGGTGGTSTSGALSGSESNSGSVSVSKGTGGNAQGGSANSNSSATGGSSNQNQTSAANNANTVAPSQNMTLNSTSPDHVKQDINYSGTQTLKSVPSVVVPNLPSVINNDMCLVSSAVGGSGIGFSVGIGFQYKDDDCIRRINARQLFNMGYQKAAIALMAQDANIAKALNDAGFSNLGEPMPTGQPEKLVQQKANPKDAVEEKAIQSTPRSKNVYEPNPVKYDMQPLVDPTKI